MLNRESARERELRRQKEEEEELKKKDSTVIDLPGVDFVKDLHENEGVKDQGAVDDLVLVLSHVKAKEDGGVVEEQQVHGDLEYRLPDDHFPHGQGNKRISF